MRLDFRRLLGMSAACPLIVAASLAGLNYCYNHDKDDYSDKQRIIRNMDGIVANTKIVIDEKFIAVRRYDPFGLGTRYYVDSDLDGDIDAIRRESSFFTLNRTVEEFYLPDKRPEEFGRANEEYSWLLERNGIELRP